MSSQGGGGQKVPLLLCKKTTKMEGGGQKSPILRRYTLQMYEVILWWVYGLTHEKSWIKTIL